MVMQKHMVMQNMINNGSGNGLMPGGTKPLPEPMLTYQSCGDFKGNVEELLQYIDLDQL